MLAKTDWRIPQPVASKVDDNPTALSKQQILEIANILNSTVGGGDLSKARTAWTKYQSSRKRNAVYGYLSAVFETVQFMKSQRGGLARLHQKLIAKKVDAIRSQDPFAVIICCTSDGRKLDAKTRSKWSWAPRYAERFKPHNQDRAQLIKTVSA